MTSASTIEERRATYAGYATRELAVEGSGPVIVLIHGFSHSAEVWRPVLDLFTEAGQSAVAIDLPGFGAADPLYRGELIPQLDAFLVDLIHHHGAARPAVVVGNSLGGALAVRAARNPDLPVGAVMPIDAAGVSYTALLSRGLVPVVASTRRLSRLRLTPMAHRAVLRRALGQLLYGHPSSIDHALVATLADDIPDLDTALQLLRLGAKFLRELDRKPHYDGIDVPMTVLHGRRDRIVPESASRTLHLANPGSRLVVVPWAGHCPHLDAPHDVVYHARRLARSSTARSTNGREIS